MSTSDPKEISLFVDYCKSIVADALLLSSKEEVDKYCSNVSKMESDFHEELSMESEYGHEIIRGSVNYHVSHTHMIKGTSRVMKKKRGNPIFMPKAVADERRLVCITGSEIDLSTITPEIAYILGGIYASGVSLCETAGKFYYACTVKQNNRPKDEGFVDNLNEHIESAVDIVSTFIPDSDLKFNRAKDVGLKNIFGVHVGFSFLFNARGLDTGKFQKAIVERIEQCNTDIIRAFLVGVFDTRGYVDKNFGYVGIDLTSELDCGKLEALLLKCNVGICNRNPSRERENNQGTPRKPQLRIKIKDFFENIGIISPDKIDCASGFLHVTKDEFKSDGLLPGLKRI